MNGRTYCGYTFKRARSACMKHHNMYFAALLISGPAAYSGKYFSSGTCETRTNGTEPVQNMKRVRASRLDEPSAVDLIDVRKNHDELLTLSDNMRDLAIRCYIHQYG